MTLYSVSYFCGGDDERTTCALFSDTTPEEAIMVFCDEISNTVAGCTCVRAVNMDTGAVLYEITDCDPEPWGIDDDCGFDPYLGCYTDDC